MVQSRIWVYLEQRQGGLAEAGLELLGKAIQLAHPLNWKVAGILVGHRLSVCEELSSFGPDEIVVVDHPLLESFSSQTYAKVLAEAVRKHQPDVFVLGGTAQGTDLGARLAARLRTGLSAHCVDFELSSQGELLAIVPGWGGNILAAIRCPRTKPQMATAMPGVFEMPKKKPAQRNIITLQVTLKPEEITSRVLDTKKEMMKADGFENAKAIVAGGWGIGNKEDWRWVEDLASALNGAVGATRPPVDEGWAEKDQMIGQSGRTVHPKLYIGVAISGQMHHMVGIRDAEMVVAINQDSEAPIFELCDLGLVGDFREILPPLIKAIKQCSV